MERDWRDFKSLHSNLAGAREAFETACEILYKAKHKDEHVSQVKVKSGDGGIDIFIGELGVKPITVIQCKFFLDSFDSSQQAQIRSSFNTAINSDKYELDRWILCVPCIIDIDETTWWFKWKHKQLKKYSKTDNSISLVNGNELINLFKEEGLYNQVFGIDHLTKIDEIHAATVPKKITLPTSAAKTNTILFNNYTEKNEPFYLERENDNQFNTSLEINNIWLFGESGVGKTALINRNLIQNNIDYCFCDLSPVSINDSEDVLKEILISIEEKFHSERNLSENNILKQISQILCNVGSEKIVIVIDELSVSENTVLKNIANDFISLVTYYRNQANRDELKFVVSTISNPISIIQNKPKASDHFQYISCNTWSDYLESLFDLLSKSLNLEIEDSKSEIIKNSKNSPRLLKNIFKKIVISNNSSLESVNNAIKQSLEEIV